MGDILHRARQHDACRGDLVDARVGGVQSPSQGIEADLAFDTCFYRVSKSGQVVQEDTTSGARLWLGISRGRLLDSQETAGKRNIKVDIW
jgi:hypothetical protein